MPLTQFLSKEPTKLVGHKCSYAPYAHKIYTISLYSILAKGHNFTYAHNNKYNLKTNFGKRAQLNLCPH